MCCATVGTAGRSHIEIDRAPRLPRSSSASRRVPGILSVHAVASARDGKSARTTSLRKFESHIETARCRPCPVIPTFGIDASKRLFRSYE